MAGTKVKAAQTARSTAAVSKAKGKTKAVPQALTPSPKPGTFRKTPAAKAASTARWRHRWAAVAAVPGPRAKAQHEASLKPKPKADPKAASKARSVPSREEKTRKPKLVRDSFTIPKSEYAALDALKRRAAMLQVPSKKSEVLRGGLMALLAMSDDAFRQTMASVPTLKTGRPSKA